jgi:hypothetical protein
MLWLLDELSIVAPTLDRSFDEGKWVKGDEVVPYAKL